MHNIKVIRPTIFLKRAILLTSLVVIIKKKLNFAMKASVKTKKVVFLFTYLILLGADSVLQLNFKK